MDSSRGAWIGLFIVTALVVGACFVVVQLDTPPERQPAWFSALMGQESIPADDTSLPGHVAHASDAVRTPLSPVERAEAAKRWNRALGIDLFQKRELWDELAGSLAQRLYLKTDTRTKHLSVYSSEQDLPAIFGVRPTQITLYANQRHRPQELHFAFANRGSIQPRLFERRLESDAAQLRPSLGGLLGKTPVRKETGLDGVERTFQEWEQDGIRVRYYGPENDFVALSLKPASAPRRPRPPGPGHWASQVIRTQRGDAMLRDIPLVRQGRKPYCVPVTIERILHYFHTPENMFTLAASGEVGYQGCSTFTIFNQTSRRLSHQGLMIKFKRKSLQNVADVKSYIDQGLPVIWLVHGYVPVFQKARARTDSRHSVLEAKDWQDDLDTDSRYRARTEAGQYHSVLIAGYNEQTNEIAVVDEMGLIWLTLTEARQISQPFLLPVAKR